MPKIQRLCIRAQSGDTAAASELLELFYTKIYTYLRRLCQTTADAEDLTQETFAKTWNDLPNFKARSTFNSWIHRIAYNTFVDWLRRNRSATYQPQFWWDSIEDKDPGPLNQLHQKLLTEKLYQAVEDLGEDKREIVHLRYYQRLSIKETAFVLDIATSTVKYRLRQAIKELKITVTETHTSENIELSLKKSKYA